MQITKTAMAMAGALAGCAGALSTAHAADLPMLAADPAVLVAPSWYSNFYAHVGAAGIFLDAGAKIYTVPGGRIAGATIKIPPQVTATAEIGYRFTPNWGVSVTLGVPPTADIYGSGSVAAFGKFGSNVYGPIAVTGHYHLTTFGRFQPYIGIGPAYMIAFDSRDGAISNMQVRSAWGAVAQVGADYMITDHFGLFIDYKKAYLRTEAVGVAFGVTPIYAKVKLDPSIVSGGLTYRF